MAEKERARAAAIGSKAPQGFETSAKDLLALGRELHGDDPAGICNQLREQQRGLRQA